MQRIRWGVPRCSSQGEKRPTVHTKCPGCTAPARPACPAGARPLILRPLPLPVGKSLARDGVRRPDADPIRKARFREAAREIVAKDRHDRKYGFAVDTAGAVARAMERAYRQGFADAQDEPPMPAAGDVQPGEAINWALIPPHPRSAFWTICLFVPGKGKRTQGGRATCARDHWAGHGGTADREF